MTVCVAVKVHDCMVFAADSASTLSSIGPNDEQTVLNVYNNADKVFNLHRDLPLMAMTCGMGHIGGKSISNLAKEFRANISKGSDKIDIEGYTVESVVRLAKSFIEKQYVNANQSPNMSDYLEFFVGGYGADATHGEIWKVVLSGGKISDPECLVDAETPFGLHWGGQTSAITRLILGVDAGFINVMMEAGVNEDNAVELYKIAREKLETNVMHPTMPIIDAIRLAEFLVDVTKGYFSFAYGSDIVGGDTDLATVTRWEGFKWIKRKHYYSEHLNRRDHDHVC